MAFSRTAISQFSIANAAYRNAIVTFYTIDPLALTATSTLATLYSASSGTDTAPNPYTLDATGKFTTPLYIEQPVIASVTQSAVENHITGIIYPNSGGWQGDWVSGREYLPGGFVRDATAGEDTGNIYVATAQHTSGTWITDLANDLWDLAIPASTVNLGSSVTGVLGVANGGTGSTTASQMRANFGLDIGDDIQAYDPVLDYMSGLTATDGGIPYFDSSSSMGLLAIGTNIQAYDINLEEFSGLNLIADRLPYADGSNSLSTTPFTAFARTLLDDATAADVRTTLGLGAMALQPTAGAAAVFGNTNFGIRGTDASHYLRLVPGSNLATNRNLTFTTGDADRTLTIQGNATLDDWFDQSVKVGATPAFLQLFLQDGGRVAPEASSDTYYVSAWDSVGAAYVNYLTLVSGASPSATLAASVAHAGGGTLVGTSATQTLTNKTLTAPNISQVVFPATQVPSANANTFDDYEEGSWTPVDGSGAGLSLPANGTYIKVGRLVYAGYTLTYPSTADGRNAYIGGLPFTCASDGAVAQGHKSFCTNSSFASFTVNTANTNAPARDNSSAAMTNAALSGAGIRGTIIYAV